MQHGFWFFSNGIPTFITGKNYFLSSWWKLEDDVSLIIEMPTADILHF